MFSIKGLQWSKKKVDTEFQHSEQKSSFVNDFLTLRNYGGQYSNFVEPKIKNAFPGIDDFKDMQKAINFLKSAIKANSKVVIFADYDVDGATSSAVLKQFLNFVGISQVDIYVPDRVKEGYGPNVEAFKNFKQQGYELVITVDCGIVAFDEIELAQKIGLDVIVIDHHVSAAEVPKAVAVVDPNRVDNPNEFGYLCGAGVVFVVCAKLAGQMPESEINQAKLKQYLFSLLDLVAIGTVCDVVPLVNLNRAIVSNGLKVINSTKNIGLQALLYKIDKQNITAEDIGFGIGPLINAAGRIGDSTLGSQLFTSQSMEESLKIAEQLINYNKQRKEIEQEALENVTKDLEGHTKDYVMMSSKDWHEGVIGIIASRIKDSTGKVSIVGSESEDVNGEVIVKASCRSNGAFDVGAAILEANAKGIIIKGGGHFAAGGFSCYKKNIPQLESFFDDIFIMTEELYKKAKERSFDFFVAPQGIAALDSELQLLEPFGMKNEAPIFCIDYVVLKDVRIVGERHLRIESKCPDSNTYVNAIWFNSANSYADTLGLKLGKKIKLIAKISFRDFRGKRYPNIIAEDIVAM